jgi:hypothetical protein
MRRRGDRYNNIIVENGGEIQPAGELFSSGMGVGVILVFPITNFELLFMGISLN